MTEGIHFGAAVKGRPLSTYSANELRARLYQRGVEIPDTVKTLDDLVKLVEKTEKQ